MKKSTLIATFTVAILITLLSCLGASYNSRPKPVPFQTFEITGGTFDLDVTVIVTSDTAMAAKYLINNIDTSYKSTMLDARGVTFIGETGTKPVVWLSTLDKEIVNHELFHTTSAILKWAGVPLTQETDEVYAYELQYLTKQFYEKIK